MWIAPIVLSVTVMVVAFFWVRQVGTLEPTYSGVKIGVWIEDFWREQTNGTTTSTVSGPAMLAVHNMGTNAIPYLLDQLERNRNRVMNPRFEGIKLEAPIPISYTTGREKAVRAMIACEILGTNAQPVIPALLPYTQNHIPAIRNRALKALVATRGRPEAVVPVLVERLSDSDLEVQITAAAGLGFYGREAYRALPVLQQATAASHYELSQAASASIRRIQDEARKVAPKR